MQSSNLFPEKAARVNPKIGEATFKVLDDDHYVRIRAKGRSDKEGLGPGPCMTVRGVTVTTEVEWLRSDHRSTANGAWCSSQRRI